MDWMGGVGARGSGSVRNFFFHVCRHFRGASAVLSQCAVDGSGEISWADRRVTSFGLRTGLWLDVCSGKAGSQKGFLAGNSLELAAKMVHVCIRGRGARDRTAGLRA